MCVDGTKARLYQVVGRQVDMKLISKPLVPISCVQISRLRPWALFPTRETASKC